MQKAILEEYKKKYPHEHPTATTLGGKREISLRRRGTSDSYDHFANFFASVRARKPVVEDAVFGYRAAGAALLSNLSMSGARW